MSASSLPLTTPAVGSPQPGPQPGPAPGPVRPSAARSTWALVACGAAMVLLLGGALAVGDRDRGELGVLALVAAGWAVLALAYPLALRVAEPVALRLVVGVGASLQGVAALWPPRTSDDAYRYAWDGRVGNHGIDPYAYPPNAHELAHLQVPWLFPAGRAPLINRPDVPTIYPPFAQAWFRLVDAVTPDAWGIRAYQLAAGLVAVAGALVLVAVLRRFGRDPRAAILWAWCPLVVLESGNNAHVDGLAAVLTVAALALLAVRRTTWGAVVLALAIGVKLTPALVGPAVVRRRPVRLLLVTGGVLLAGYLPHLLSVGGGVAGFLPGYLSEEGYDDGSRFALLGRVLPAGWTAAVAALVLLAFTVRTVWRSTPSDPFADATAMVGVALLLTTPTYPWYSLLLVALCVAADRAAWLAVAAGAALPYLGGWTGLGLGSLEQIGYGLGGAVVAFAYLRRRKRRLRAGSQPSGANG